MKLTRHQTPLGARWAADGKFLTQQTTLSVLLSTHAAQLSALIAALRTDEDATGDLLAPLDAMHEVWACGVTYLRSRDARMAESTQASVYDRVYAAERPEIFFKSIGWRVVANGAPIRIRADSTWDVPEPELTLVVNAHGEIVGYTAGNDVSSRSIEGDNPLYLPQAKTYTGSCALGDGILLMSAEAMRELPVALTIERDGAQVFSGESAIHRMKRTLPELATWLRKELDLPHGALLMTGTGIVPPESFTLRRGDRVTISIGDLQLSNVVA
jgi:2-dehydro-3-deoxy-D-arabinonate dehydratase